MGRSSKKRDEWDIPIQPSLMFLNIFCRCWVEVILSWRTRGVHLVACCAFAGHSVHFAKHVQCSPKGACKGINLPMSSIQNVKLFQGSMLRSSTKACITRQSITHTSPVPGLPLQLAYPKDANDIMNHEREGTPSNSMYSLIVSFSFFDWVLFNTTYYLHQRSDKNKGLAHTSSLYQPKYRLNQHLKQATGI